MLEETSATAVENFSMLLILSPQNVTHVDLTPNCVLPPTSSSICLKFRAIWISGLVSSQCVESGLKMQRLKPKPSASRVCRDDASPEISSGALRCRLTPTRIKCSMCGLTRPSATFRLPQIWPANGNSGGTILTTLSCTSSWAKTI